MADSTGLIAEGEEHFQRGDLDAAERCFRSALEREEIASAPARKAEALNDLGVVSCARSENAAAIGWFTHALEADPENRDAAMNLCGVLGEIGKLTEALPLLDRLLAKSPEDPDLRALRQAATEEAAAPGRLAVLCLPGLESFVRDVAGRLASTGAFEVKQVYSSAPHEIGAAIDAADVVWIEWANELAVRVTADASRLAKKRIVCRLHSYEAFAPFVGEIRWEAIDDLIFVAGHIRRLVELRVPDLAQRVRRIHVVPNGVDLARFPLAPKKNPPRRIAYLGSINYKKGPQLLLQAFSALAAADRELVLFVGGDFQDIRYQLYFDQLLASLDLAGRVRLEGRIQDPAAWLADKDAIVCTSIVEGHPVAPLEAMATGCRPLIHEFVGARELYPASFLWRTLPELVSLAAGVGGSAAEYRAFAERFSIEAQIESLGRILSSRIA